MKADSRSSSVGRGSPPGSGFYIQFSRISEAGVSERLCSEEDRLRCHLSPMGERVITTGKYHAMLKNMVPAKGIMADRCKQTKGLRIIFKTCERHFARAKPGAHRVMPMDTLSVLGTVPAITGMWPNSAILNGESCIAMPDHSIRRASNLAGDERLIVERWLGRALSNDETISVNAYRPHPFPIAPDDKSCGGISWPRHVRSARAEDIADREIKALVGEAFADVRGRRIASV